MNIVRKALIDRMANLYGQHSFLTILFIDLCKRTAEDGPENDKMLIELVQSHEKYPITEYLKKRGAKK